jgi:hypothetical protein
LIHAGSSATDERLDRDAIGSQEPFAPTDRQPREAALFRYKLHFEDGSEAGDAAFADNVNRGDELMLGPADVEGPPYAALLKVEAARAS